MLHENGAEAIGLVSEQNSCTWMHQDFPTEDDQYEAYKKAVLEGMNGKPVVVRTMDIGGDKHLALLGTYLEEMNPFLGCACT